MDYVLGIFHTQNLFENHNIRYNSLNEESVHFEAHKNASVNPCHMLYSNTQSFSQDVCCAEVHFDDEQVHAYSRDVLQCF
jgi:hypothetical protein